MATAQVYIARQAAEAPRQPRSERHEQSQRHQENADGHKQAAYIHLHIVNASEAPFHPGAQAAARTRNRKPT